MSDLEAFAIWYVAVLFLGSVAMVVESRRARPPSPPKPGARQR